jgi:hypothetical protein
MIDIENIAGAEQWFAPLFNPHRTPLGVADHKVKNLVNRLV